MSSLPSIEYILTKFPNLSVTINMAVFGKELCIKPLANGDSPTYMHISFPRVCRGLKPGIMVGKDKAVYVNTNVKSVDDQLTEVTTMDHFVSLVYSAWDGTSELSPMWIEIFKKYDLIQVATKLVKA